MCMEFAVGSGIPDSLWVRIKGYINNADVIVGACNGHAVSTMTPMNYSLRK